MFCPNCGKNVKVGTKHCPECGSKVSGEAEGNESAENSDRDESVIDSSDKEKESEDVKNEDNTNWNPDFDKSMFLLILLTAIIVSMVCFSFVFSLDGDAIPVGSEILEPTSPLDADTDNDGLKDGVELKAYETDALEPDTDGDGLKDGRELNDLNTNPISSDTDDDGLTDDRELKDLGTNPVKSDSDSDGLNDSIEVSGETDATKADSDSDGLEDGRELEIGADPLVRDTDKDGLQDGREVSKYNSNSLKPYSDSDGLKDGKEVKMFGTSPVTVDTDDDGLNDSAEIRIHDTIPTVKDTDNDSLSDGREIEVGTDPLIEDSDSDSLSDGRELEVNSNPLSVDSDSDGLKDGEEVNTYDTSPVKTDTDSDGVEDKEEIEIGTESSDADTDGDKLSDGREIEVGTNPRDNDTDADGLPDGLEDDDSNKVTSNMDPLRKDIFVELDSDSDVKIPRKEFGVVISTFENAPIDNPDGSSGIDLHIFPSDSENMKDKQSLSYYRKNSYQNLFDLKGKGFYHVLVVNEVVSTKGDAVGVTSPRIDGMLVENSQNDGRVASTFMHEMGHQLGLYNTDFDGIDSTKYSFNEYPSAMNYNCRNQNKLFVSDDCSVYKFSSDGKFDDWNHIENSFPEVAPSTKNIR